jgi:hypothetical protein
MTASMWFLLGVAVGALPTIVGWVQVYADMYAQRERERELNYYQRGWDACSQYMKGDEHEQ